MYWFESVERFKTPKFLSEMAYRFLDIKEGDSVADIGCGTGEFLKYIQNKGKNLSLYGCEFAGKIFEELKKNKELNHKNVELEYRDANGLMGKREFDKIFIDIQLSLTEEFEEGLKNTLKRSLNIEDFAKSIKFYDLYYAAFASQLIKENGKAMVILSSTSCSNSNGRFLREFLIKKGYINTVISLPSKIVKYKLPITVVIITKNNNSVSMYDGTTFGTKEGRKALKNGDGIAQLHKAFQTCSKDVHKISYDEIINNNYDFTPTKYCKQQYTVKCQTELQEVLSILRRGVINGNKSNYYYNKNNNNSSPNSSFVRTTNLVNGCLIGSLDRIDKKYIPKNAIPLENGDILLSKTIKPVKCAVVENINNNKTYFQENLYLLRVDKNKIDPYYLCAFLNSKYGQQCLQMSSVYGEISTIPIKELKNMKIYLPEMQKQKEIGELFKSNKKEIEDLTKKINQSTNKLYELFYENFN